MPDTGRRASGAIDGSNTSGRTVQRTYEEYAASQRTSEIRRQLEEEYALRYKVQQKYNLKDFQERQKYNEELAKYQQLQQKKNAEQERKTRLAQLKELQRAGLATKEDKKEAKQLETQEKQAAAEEKRSQLLQETLQNVGNKIEQSISKLTSKVDSYIEVVNSYSASVNTRLQGTEKTYDTITSLFSGKLAGSPFVKQTEVLENLSKLVDQGIAYNVEQRAFLASMTDKMVTTFDAANSTLLRIIRLQQADSTIARMGMESALNKFLNATYEDTSYLTDTYDQVESALVEVISQLGRDAGVEFEYIAQKWLGSLGSVGMSSNTLVSLAEGINALATGDVSYLSNNSALQNLLVMASNRAGLSYSSMLTNGMNADNLNALFQGIVEYGQEIASTSNMVVKSQYADLFGLTLSDMTALLQMGDDLSYVINETLSYSDAVQETANQLASVGSRMSTSELINNVFDNIMMSAATGLANSTAGYVTWLITNVVEEATGGINIPFVSVLGSGIDLNASVTQLMKVGLIGASLLGQIGNIIGGLSSGGALSLNGWNAAEYTSRGTGFTGINAGVSQTTSFSAAVGNSGGQDIIDSSITQSKEEASQSVSGQESEESDMMEEIRANVSEIAQIMKAVFDGGALRVNIQNYGLTGVGSSTL